jgi:hypothetical protein
MEKKKELEEKKLSELDAIKEIVDKLEKSHPSYATYNRIFCSESMKEIETLEKDNKSIDKIVSNMVELISKEDEELKERLKKNRDAFYEEETL